MYLNFSGFTGNYPGGAANIYAQSTVQFCDIVAPQDLILHTTMILYYILYD